MSQSNGSEKTVSAMSVTVASVGRFRTTPAAPSSEWSSIRITVLVKNDASKLGEAIRR